MQLGEALGERQPEPGVLIFARQAAVDQGLQDARADEEVGGADASDKWAVARQALDRLGTPELTEMLNQSGLGNHKEFIRVFYKVGKAIADGSFVPASGAASDNKSPADKFYDKAS